MTQDSKFEWNKNLRQFKPKGFKQEKEKFMSNENVETYELTRKNGRVDTIRFTGKRGQILEHIKAGLSNEEIQEKGFSKHTVSVVRWQAGKVGILTNNSVESVA